MLGCEFNHANYIFLHFFNKLKFTLNQNFTFSSLNFLLKYVEFPRNPLNLRLYVLRVHFTKKIKSVNFAQLGL